MSKTRTKEELVRLAWIAKLRSEGDRQCRHTFMVPLANERSAVCALALLHEVTGGGEPPRTPYGVVDYCGIGKRAGLNAAQSQEVIDWNDGGAPFGAIADVVANWFPETKP